MQHTTLKDTMKSSAENNLKKYKQLLDTLERSNLQDKEERILQCRHAIRKQEQILQNISKY